MALRSQYVTSKTDVRLTIDLLRCRTSLSCIRYGPAHPSRPRSTHLLRSLRTHASRPLQRHSIKPTKRCHWEVKVLRRHAYPNIAVNIRTHGILAEQGMGPGSDARWQCRAGDVVRVSLGDIVVCWSWVLDGQQDFAHSQAMNDDKTRDCFGSSEGGYENRRIVQGVWRKVGGVLLPVDCLQLLPKRTTMRQLGHCMWVFWVCQ